MHTSVSYARVSIQSAYKAVEHLVNSYIRYWRRKVKQSILILQITITEERWEKALTRTTGRKDGSIGGGGGQRERE